MRRFLRPWWVVSHVLVLALIVVMINLGFWQLRRLEERRDLNALQAERTAAAVVAADALSPEIAAGGVGAVEYRVVEVTGRYRASDEVAVRNRTLSGLPGVWLLTPLVPAEGPALVVNRGWVPQSSSDPAARPPTPVPDGEVQSYTRVSRWARRHDKSLELNYVVPETDEMGAELALVRDWFHRIKRYAND